MEQHEPARDAYLSQLPRITQACEADCAFFETVGVLEDWGWCHDPSCPFRQGLVRRGHECPRFAARPAGRGR
jgi:hypothetical protein